MLLIETVQALASAVPATGGSNAAAVSSVWDFLVKGGVLMIPIGLCSLAVVAVTVERLVVVATRRVAPPGLAGAVRTAVTSGGADAKRLAHEACAKQPSPLARVLAAGIDQMGRPIEAVEKHMASAGEHEVFELRRRMRVLSVITAAAPLLGLLGTIFGMITAFQTVAMSGEALGRTELLAKGIYEAMITTAAGLMVAIPSLVVYHWLTGRIEKAVRIMDRECTDIAGRLAGPAGAVGIAEPRLTPAVNGHAAAARADVVVAQS